MLEAIHENHKRTQELKAMIIKMEERRIKRQERNILLICGITFALLVITMILYNNRDIENCVKKGYSENYCLQNLG